MKKFIFIIFSIFIFCSGNLFAADQVTICEIIDGKCPAGCEGISHGGCKICPPGTYNDTPGGECKPCTIPNGGKYKDDNDEYSGFVVDKCPWEASCNKDQYWKSWESDDTLFGCMNCGENYESVLEDGYTIEGAGKEALQSPDEFLFGKVCDFKAYEVKLNKNTNINKICYGNTENDCYVYSDKSVFYKYSVGFSIDKTLNNWTKNLPTEALQESNVLRDFLGYTLIKNNEYSLVFDEYGNPGEKWDPLTSVPTELYALWKNYTVSIVYMGLNGEEEQDACSVDEKQAEFSCKAKRYTGETPQNKFFDHYACFISGKSCGIISVGDVLPINKLSSQDKTIVLQAVFVTCPAGRYCDEYGIHECPAGTTSLEGKGETVSDCYVQAGTNGTKFCDKNGCFFLPGVNKIYKNPS